MTTVAAASVRRPPLLGPLGAALLLSGCTARPPERAAQIHTTAQRPAAIESRQPERPNLREESIEDDDGRPRPERGDVPPSAAPDDGTPPQVVAATRLAEEGHRRMAAGQSDAALDLLERAVALDSNNSFAYLYLAEAYFELGRYDQALAFADRAATLGTTVPPQWRSRSYALQGQILETAGQFERARAAYRKALANDAANLAARAGLARLGDESP
jgi:Tfp pilus assembly protein PilF